MKHENWAPLNIERGSGEPLSFEWNGVEQSKEIEVTARKLLKDGQDYLRSVVAEYPFPKQYIVCISPRARHANLGSEMYLSAARLTALKTADQYVQDLEQSQVIHELVHNLCDTEDLPMLIELAYMLERGHDARIEKLHSILKDGGLSKVYIDGLLSIANMLGFADPNELLLNISEQEVERMKALFQARIQEILRELEDDVASGRASIIS